MGQPTGPRFAYRAANATRAYGPDTGEMQWGAMKDSAVRDPQDAVGDMDRPDVNIDIGSGARRILQRDGLGKTGTVQDPMEGRGG